LTELDPLDRVGAAAERLRGQARGGPRSFRHATDEYRELLAAIAASRHLPVRDVARAAGISANGVRDLRRRGG
jgi:hypothetical protein